MKFQKLTIHNIASIEDAVIDFEAQPLADSEVFLITGKTGSGKSTILDAICLALYANTPRLNDTKMEGETMDEKKVVKINDTRQLMRRNTGEASVTLTFIGSNSVHYEATWAVARANKKATGNLQPKSWQLVNLDTDQTISKDKEIKAEIKAAIGLDFSQFCRTTMLAQGEFTRFLNSKDDEKAEILEKITGVDVYSKIGAKVYAVTSQKKETWQRAKLQVEGTSTLSEDQIAEKQEALTQLDRQCLDLKAIIEKQEAKRDWIKADSEFKEKTKTAEENLRLANEQVESETFKAQELLIQEWNATIDARTWWTEMQKAEVGQKAQQSKLAELAGEFASLLGGQRLLQQEIEKAQTELAKLEQSITTEASKAKIYENAQTIVSHLTTISEGQTAINYNSQNIQTETKALQDVLVPAYEAAKQKTQVAKEDRKNLEAEVKQQEETIQALKLNELRTQQEAAKELLNKIETAFDRVNMMQEAQKKYEATQQELTKQKAELEAKQQKTDSMQAAVREAKIRMDVRKEDLDKQKDTIHKFASTLRLKLKVGDTCPVCRQQINADLPHEDELAALVNGLQEAYNTAEKEYNALAEAKNKIDAEIQAETSAYEKAVKAHHEDQTVVQATQKAQEACQVCGLTMTEVSPLIALDELKTKTATQSEMLKTQISEGENKEKELTALRKKLNAKAVEVEKLANLENETEKKVNESKGRITTATALVETKKKEVATAETAVSGWMTTGPWDNDWQTSPQAFSTELTLAAKRYKENEQKKQILTNQLETATTYSHNVEMVFSSMVETMPEWENITHSNATDAKSLLEQANDTKHRLTIVQTQLAQLNESCRINREKLDAFWNANGHLNEERLKELCAYTANQITKIDVELKQYRDAVVAKKSLVENAQKQQAEHQQKQPALEEDETLETLNEQIQNNSKQLEELGQKKGGIQQELKVDQDNKTHLGKLIEDTDKKKEDYDKWSQLNTLIGDAEGKRFRKIAQSYVLSSLIHSANSYMRTLTDRYTLKVTPGTFVIMLEDAYQGYAARAASTISGGESFLVSLSLALALSDIGQTLSVDTLFIDEGFGTLSGEPLQNAISTLRSLHNKSGRHVGIISHVEELQERIPVQIQVNQEDNNSCSKISIIP